MRQRQRAGTVYLVGAGPGRPDLLTLRAADLIAQADTLIYDRLIHPGVLERHRRGARLIYVGKEGGGEQTTQAQINALLISQAKLGRQVVRLKGGDPFVFGRGGEEALALAEAKIRFEVVPGVSSGFSVPALAGIPVTHRGAATHVTFATAHCATTQPDWAHLARAQTLVLFMGGTRLSQSTAALIKAGRAAHDPVALIEAGSLEQERVIEGTLADIAEKAAAADVGSPALLVIGDVTRIRQQLLPSLAQGRASPPALKRRAAR